VQDRAELLVTKWPLTALELRPLECTVLAIAFVASGYFFRWKFRNKVDLRKKDWISRLVLN